MPRSHNSSAMRAQNRRNRAQSEPACAVALPDPRNARPSNGLMMRGSVFCILRASLRKGFIGSATDRAPMEGRIESRAIPRGARHAESSRAERDRGKDKQPAIAEECASRPQVYGRDPRKPGCGCLFCGVEPCGSRRAVTRRGRARPRRWPLWRAGNKF